MRSARILIPVILMVSIVTLPFLLSSDNPSRNQVNVNPSALNYALNYTNKSVDLSVISNENSYLYIITKFNNSTVVNKTNLLTTKHSFSFSHPGQFYSFSASLFTPDMKLSDLTFFIANMTIHQPQLFYINHSVSQENNKTLLWFTTSSKLNLRKSFINSVSILTTNKSKGNFFSYNALVTTPMNTVSLDDYFNRTYSDSIYVNLTSASGNGKINSTNSTISNLQFSYSYQISNINSIDYSINATEQSFAMVNLTSSTDFFTNQSLVPNKTHFFLFTNLSFTKYQVSITVWNGNSTRNITSELTINDTTNKINPTLVGTSQTITNNSIVYLAFNTSEPTIVNLYYGTNKSPLASFLVNNAFQSIFLINLSNFMFQNSWNYYYFIIKDSNGLATTCDNGSNYYSIYIPKIDFTTPWNTSLITLNKNNTLSFTTNEDVNVTVLCQDVQYLMSQFACANQQNYATNFSLNLQVPITGMSYIIQEVIITDKAGNKTIINLNLFFNG